MPKLRAAIQQVRTDLAEGIAPFRTVHQLSDTFLTRASRDSFPDPKANLSRAWQYKQAAESREDKNGIGYWTRKYDVALEQYRQSVRARNFNLDETDADETGYIPPHRQ